MERDQDRVRVLIADDEPTMRAALSDLIVGEATLELVGVADDAEHAVTLAIEHMPDVALLDVRMPGGGGPAAVRGIREGSPATRSIAFSAHDDRGTVLEMLQAGADGYLLKGTGVLDILATIRDAADGRGALSPAIASQVIDEVHTRLSDEDRSADLRRRAKDGILRVLGGRGLRMVFQPIVQLCSGRTVGVEALARFDAEPERPPDQWFSEAHRLGLQVELEAAAIRTAVADAARDLPEDQYLSLNLSPDTAASLALHDALDGFPADRIVLEVTEHIPVLDYERTSRSLRLFRECGTKLAVDDAGAGFASFRHIIRLAPDIIKLDISITSCLEQDPACRALASALTTFSSDIGADIVAEGVETGPQVRILEAIGVTHGQGYYLGRPAPLTS